MLAALERVSHRHDEIGDAVARALQMQGTVVAALTALTGRPGADKT